MANDEPEVLIGEIVDDEYFEENFQQTPEKVEAKPDSISEKLQQASSNISSLNAMLGRFRVR